MFRLLVLTVLFVAWNPGRVSGQPVMETILTNGPSSNRLNIVVLSEGYTTNQLGQFLVDATNAVNALLLHQPYQGYRSYINAYAIKVASVQSGSDHPSYPLLKDTYFNSSYDAVSDLLITIPTNSSGQGRVDALLQGFMPKCHLSVLLVNDPAYGGSDGFDKTAISYNGASVDEILPHEVGHVLANLGDEYELPYPGYPDTEEPNTTRENRREFIKWKAWISTNTPVPTPATAPYGGVVGLFEGAHYHTTNWYRPKLDCAMRSYAGAFCEVCTEALALSIYSRIRPVETFAPGATNFSVTTTQAIAFNLSLLQPLTHNLTVQWFTNGGAINGATNVSFSFFPQLAGNGTHVVSALVRDTTSFVRTDPTNLLSQTVSWTVSVSVPQLHLDNPLWLAGGKFAFRVSGHAPQGFVIQSATNFINWVPLTTNFLVGGQFWYTNSVVSSFPKRGFRAVTPP